MSTPTPTENSPAPDQIPAEALAFVETFGELLHFVPGEEIWNSSEPSSYVLGMIESGSASLALSDMSGISLADVVHGDFFAESHLLKTGGAAIELVAQTRCTVRLLQESRAWEMLTRWPALAVKIMKSFNEQNRRIRENSGIATQRQLRPLALLHVDPVTGARRAGRMSSVFARQLLRSARNMVPSTIATFSVSNRDSIREHLGEKAVEDILAALYGVIEQMCRPTDLSGRSNDIAISVLLPGTAMEEAKRVVERVEKGFADTVVMGSNRLPVPVMLKSKLSAIDPDDDHSEVIRAIQDGVEKPTS